MPSKVGRIFKFAKNLIEAGEPAALMLVVDHGVGSPGRRGFKMCVSSSGETVGTIGGGVMEYKFIAMAREFLKSGERSFIQRQNHDPKAKSDRSGMICSGYQVNALIRLDNSTLGVVSEITASPSGGIFGAGPSGISFESGAPLGEQASFEEREDSWRYREPIGPTKFIYIIGGGHVGLALSKVMADLDFEVVVIDHRDDLEMFRANKYADRIICCPYEDIPKYVIEGSSSFAAIVSTNFKTDEAALRACLPLRLRYLGVMGSEAKIAHLKSLVSSELSACPSTVHAPIGLPISSHTAEEIAISIAAEIIKVRNSE